MIIAEPVLTKRGTVNDKYCSVFWGENWNEPRHHSPTKHDFLSVYGGMLNKGDTRVFPRKYYPLSQILTALFEPIIDNFLSRL